MAEDFCCLEEKRAAYMNNLERLSEKQGNAVDFNYGGGSFSKTISESQDFAENGFYEKAEEKLSELLVEGLASDWKSFIEKRIQILQKWKNSEKIEISDYREFYLNVGPEWFRLRAKPIVNLWKNNNFETKDKFSLISDLLDKYGDIDGKVLFLESVADLKGVEEKVTRRALLDAGRTMHKAKKIEQAKKYFEKVEQLYPKTHEYEMSVFYLGLILKEEGMCQEAIQKFKKILNPKLNSITSDKNEKIVVISHIYYSSLNISECYESLGDIKMAIKYLEIARYRFSVFGWGDTGLGYQHEVEKRIEKLREG
jgi:tetratricopeptide (TPR) repeat protein